MAVDDRDDLQRMRRIELYAEADAQGIQYPPDHPAEGMRALLRAMGINRHNMKTLRWRTQYPSEQEIMAAQHQGMATGPQSYPERQVHQSARDGVDTSAILQRRLTETEEKNDAQADEIKRLREENDQLKSALGRIAALEAKVAAATEVELDGDGYWDLYRKAKDMGLDVERGMRREQLEKMITEARQ